MELDVDRISTSRSTPRAQGPLTGIVLVTEMTADVTMLLPMLGACAMAMLTPTLLKDPPIYDSLRERTVKRERARLD
jgi:chloride channel protein, CIC family